MEANRILTLTLIRHSSLLQLGSDRSQEVQIHLIVPSSAPSFAPIHNFGDIPFLEVRVKHHPSLGDGMYVQDLWIGTQACDFVGPSSNLDTVLLAPQSDTDKAREAQHGRPMFGCILCTWQFF
jgi:hypothetical protein